MPLDGHSYLVSQGWGGKGTALREGAISRPITVAQKKNLGGLGRDRDEAFPFWDHLFSAAAKSIQIKYTSDDEGENGSDSSTTAALTLKRTSTGILSTRRPVEGTPAASGSTTPNIDDQPQVDSRLSLVAHAKREAAKRGLYSRFFRGPIIGPEAIEAEEKRLAALVSETFDKASPNVKKLTIMEHIEVETKDHERLVVDLEFSRSVKHKKRSDKGEEKECKKSGDDDDERQRARKKRRKEEKRKKLEGLDTAETASTSEKVKKHKSESKAKAKSNDDTETTAIPLDSPTKSLENEEGGGKISQSQDRKHKAKSKSKNDATVATILPETQAESGSSTLAAGEKIRESKEERARRKEEKRRAKAQRKSEPLADLKDVELSTLKADDRRPSQSSRGDKPSKNSRKLKSVDDVVVVVEEPTKKKKRKRTDG